VDEGSVLGARSNTETPEEANSMKIVGLIAENVKRIKIVEVRPKDQSVIVIGGQNDQGKSSLLDAIEMALEGKRSHPKEPLRRGAKRGRVVVDLGDMVVTRTFAAGGGTELKVESKAGKQFSSPQAMLDKLYSALTFDPLSFERQDAADQSETIRRIVGLDFRALDEKRQSLYDERTDENRSLKALQVTYDAASHYDDAPTEEISIDDLALELEQAERLQRAADKAERAVEAADADAKRIDQAIDQEQQRVDELRRMLATSEAKLVELRRQRDDQEDVISRCAGQSQEASEAVPDTTQIRARLAAANSVNEKVRQNQRHADALAMLEDARARVAELTTKIDSIDDDKAEQLASAKYPVAGLGMAPDGTVLFNAIPFEQASTSDRIRVSVSIGLALNPTLRILLVRDGSLIGAAKLKIIEDAIREADAQLWIEMMQEQPNALTTIFIHDGMIAKETNGPAAAKA
jgi:hypothetical protein